MKPLQTPTSNPWFIHVLLSPCNKLLDYLSKASSLIAIGFTVLQLWGEQ